MKLQMDFYVFEHAFDYDNFQTQRRNVNFSRKLMKKMKLSLSVCKMDGERLG